MNSSMIQARQPNLLFQIITRIDDMAARIDDLESNINDLMVQAGQNETSAIVAESK